MFATAIIRYDPKTNKYKQEPPDLEFTNPSEASLFADYTVDLKSELGNGLDVYILSNRVCYPIADIRGRIEGEDGLICGFLAPTDQHGQEFELRYFAIVEVE